MQHAVDLDARDGRALQRGQQHAPKRVAERQAEAALERLGDHRRDAPALGAELHVELVRFDEVLPVLLDNHPYLSTDCRRFVSGARAATTGGVTRCSN